MTKSSPGSLGGLAAVYYDDGARATASIIWARASQVADQQHREMRGKVDPAGAQEGPSVWTIIEEMVAFEAQSFDAGMPTAENQVDRLRLFDEFRAWREQLKAALKLIEKR